jgi:hypothetical protein
MYLGSSKGWGPTCPDGYEGGDLFQTPPFDGFKIVFALYCDGGMWTGNSTDEYKGNTLYYRGRLLLDALLDTLLSMGLKTADQVVYGGSSAGASTVFNHIDYVRSRLPDSMQLMGLGDGGLFLDKHYSTSPEYKGQPLYQWNMKWGFTAWNSAHSVNQACLEHYGNTNAWKCFTADVVRFIEQPTFVINSKYDTFSWHYILNASCLPSEIWDRPGCKDDDSWEDFGRSMVDLAHALPLQHGVFLTNCRQHVQSGDSAWYKAIVHGTSLKDAFLSWYEAQSAKRPHAVRIIPSCPKEPCEGDMCPMHDPNVGLNVTVDDNARRMSYVQVSYAPIVAIGSCVLLALLASAWYAWHIRNKRYSPVTEENVNMIGPK